MLRHRVDDAEQHADLSAAGGNRWPNTFARRERECGSSRDGDSHRDASGAADEASGANRWGAGGRNIATNTVAESERTTPGRVDPVRRR